MRKLSAVAAGSVPLFMTGAALAQNGPMMNGSMSGGWMSGYGGYGLPVLLVVVVGVLVWVVVQKRK